MALRVLYVGLLLLISNVVYCQDYDTGGEDEMPAAPPPALNTCNGIFLSYNFISREKEFPHVKNVSAQAWAFKSIATILNAGSYELKAWKMFVGFQHREMLVSVGGAVLSNGDDLPASVGNGTYFSGYPMTDLKDSIETAGDMTQIQVQIEIKGTQFGLKPKAVPMPKTIRLATEGYKCPKPTTHKTDMHVCCVKNPKFKANITSTKFMARKMGDLSLMYDVTSAFEGNYFALVTIENNHPLGRLDSWNLTWEWMRGEFIYSMKGAYPLKQDYSECIYGPAGSYYKDFDFTPVLNCQRKPIIADLPSDRAKDEKIGNIPHCCRSGSLLPATMDPSKSKAAFQLQVFKTPPDMNRTALTPPQKWKINGVLNPDYECAAPIRVSPSEFPDPSGLNFMTTAVASWQVVCNITRPKNKHSRCCVSFSAYYNDSVIPCNTCACGCQDTTSKCDQDSPPMLLPSEALLVPFDNRTAKAKAWAKIKHFPVPDRLPCGDNCGVSINWHISADYRDGWSARITLFNWGNYIFEDWFTAVQMKKFYKGYENVYSFNGTKIPGMNNTLLLQGFIGMNYLIGIGNGTNPKQLGPPIPGKQQSVISFKKKLTPGLKIARGDGFPSRVYFNGEECELPSQFPMSYAHRSQVNLLLALFLTVVIFIQINESLW